MHVKLSCMQVTLLQRLHGRLLRQLLKGLQPPRACKQVGRPLMLCNLRYAEVLGRCMEPKVVLRQACIARSHPCAAYQMHRRELGRGMTARVWGEQAQAVLIFSSCHCTVHRYRTLTACVWRAGAGRAQYVPDQLLEGVPDPGAMAAAFWLQGLADAL